MASVVEVMSELERFARALWLVNAVREKHGCCDTCKRTKNDDGRPLYVARQPHRRDFECLQCWEERKA